MSDPATLHPIIEAMAPSQDQRPAITARGRDVVMTAGAGAGKTRTLVARYLALLVEGAPLRRIIAITFTEKAAREMRNRVRSQVRRYLETPDLAELERERWQAVYGDLDAARISTIHGLCAEILRSHPAEAGVDPRFDVLDEGRSNVARRRAVEETLAWAAERSELLVLFALLGEMGLRERLDDLTRRRWDAAEAFDAMPADVLPYWRQQLLAVQTQALTALTADPAWQQAATTLQSEVALNPDDLAEIQRRAACEALTAAALAESAEEQLRALAPLASINLVGGSARNWPGGKAQLDAVKSALRIVRELWKQARILSFAINPMDEALAPALAGLRLCFEHVCILYDAFKRDRQALDFDDLEAGALALLERDPAVRERWQEETAALLVDEFQDTNSRQRRLVDLLNNESGKLFIVGDAKQSIYRFRGADVTVFRKAREDIAGAGGMHYPLDTSYRGHRHLLAGLNALLRPVLGETADPGRPWVEPFAPLNPYREDAEDGLSDPYIELHLAVGTKSEGGLERAADALAARLLALVEAQDISIKDEGRPLSYGDVAILCRASTSFVAYEDAFERAGIPFFTVAGRGFYGRPEIRDLLNALTALADPTDDLALAGLLRSPAFALSDAALYQLVEMRQESKATPPPHLWDILRARGETLPGKDGERAARAAHLIARLHAQSGRAPVADLLKAVLDATGYRAALVAAGQSRAARNVSKLLADAHASRMTSAAEFLEYVAELRDSGVREGEARAALEGAVQIMSVHAAKGLEFPIVVLGDVTYRQPVRNTTLLDPTLGVLLPQKDEENLLPAIYQLGKLTADDKEKAESDRLLYVAATRAREMLILSGCIKLKSGGAPAVSDGWMGRLSGPEALGLSEMELAGTETTAEPLHLDLAVADSPVGCSIYGRLWSWRGASAQATATPEVAAVLPPPLLSAPSGDGAGPDTDGAGHEDIPQRVWRVVPPLAHKTPPSAPAWVVGALVHEALAGWRFPDDSFTSWIMARARGYGLTDPHQLHDASQKTVRLLSRFREHSLYMEMTAAGQRLMEVPYSRMDGNGRVESGVIDALYLGPSGWTVVEFKTDHVKDRIDLERTLKEGDYLTQTERYDLAVTYLLGQRPRLRLCFLDVAGGVFLREVDGAQL